MHDCESDQSVDNQQGKMATHKVFFFFSETNPVKFC